MTKKPEAVQEEEISIGVFGDSGIGKTTIIIQFLKSIFVEEHDPTIEDYFETSRYFGKQQKTITKLSILDSAGQEDYQTLVPQQMRDAEGFMVVYSITDKKSFEKVVEFQKKITQVKEKVKKIPIILIGNKIDLEESRQVTREEGQKLAKEFGIPFLETSAKTRINIDESFEQISLDVRKSRQQEKDGKTKNKSEKKDGGCLLQ
eukprot:gene9948-2269_t